MRILLVGGTGFIGSALCQHFSNQGYVVSVLTRDLNKTKRANPSIHFINTLDNLTLHYDVIINLAGQPLHAHRWTPKTQKILYSSRILSTQKVIDYLAKTDQKPKLLISASAVGFYGIDQDQTFTEKSKPIGESFAQTLCTDWEKRAEQALEYGVRVCLIRTGIVLGKKGGILQKLLPLFRLGLGATLGDGKQWMSWIHLDDVVGAIDFLITQESMVGPINLTSPCPVTNQVFSKTVAQLIHRPLLFRLPSFFVQLLYGEMGRVLLLEGQKVSCEALLNAGYAFKFSQLADALRDILDKKNLCNEKIFFKL